MWLSLHFRSVQAAKTTVTIHIRTLFSISYIHTALVPRPSPLAHHNTWFLGFNMKHNPARQKALADAAAGVIGSLVSVLVFYPVDVWKTNLQAGKHPSHDANESEDVNDVVLISTNETVKLNSATISQWLLRVSRIFRGLSYKITHTTVSSFA